MLHSAFSQTFSFCPDLSQIMAFIHTCFGGFLFCVLITYIVVCSTVIIGKGQSVMEVYGLIRT